jgi:hypothetical protein
MRLYILYLLHVMTLHMVLTNSVALESDDQTCSQKPATGSYPETIESTPPPRQSHQDLFWFHPPFYVFRVVSFLRAFIPKPCTIFSPLPYVPHALPTSFSSTSEGNKMHYEDFKNKYWETNKINSIQIYQLLSITVVKQSNFSEYRLENSDW